MTTAAEFLKNGITGQTFREITEKFGKPIDKVGEDDKVMSLYTLAFAWFRNHEHMEIQAAYDKAMSLTPGDVEALFEDSTDLEVEALADFVSPPPKTTP